MTSHTWENSVSNDTLGPQGRGRDKLTWVLLYITLHVSMQSWGVGGGGVFWLIDGWDVTECLMD